jgi:Uncharacterized protein conserved in bacteria
VARRRLVTEASPGVGHNSDKSVSAQRLKSFVERIERVEVDAENIKVDRKTIYSEAKSAGFDTKTMRQCVKLRKMDKSDRQEQDALLDLYMGVLGE